MTDVVRMNVSQRLVGSWLLLCRTGVGTNCQICYLFLSGPHMSYSECGISLKLFGTGSCRLIKNLTGELGQQVCGPDLSADFDNF